MTRAHPIHSQIPPVNNAVHAAFTAKDPTTIRQYYKLIGVQATPVNGPPPATAPSGDLSYYYLANIVVETNQTLPNFFGKANSEGTTEPFPNVDLNARPGAPSKWAAVKVVTAHRALGGPQFISMVNRGTAKSFRGITPTTTSSSLPHS